MLSALAVGAWAFAVGDVAVALCLLGVGLLSAIDVKRLPRRGRTALGEPPTHERVERRRGGGHQVAPGHGR